MNILVKKDTIKFAFISIIAAIIVGLRGDTNDTQVYYSVFLNIDNLPLLNPAEFYQATGMEIGWGWFSLLVSYFTNSNVILFSLFSFINFYFIYKSCREIGIKYSYAFLIYISSSYFFMQQFMQMRQGLAVSIVIYAAILILKRGLNFKHLSLLLLAFSFHQSSLLLIFFCAVFYFFRKSWFFSFKYFISANGFVAQRFEMQSAPN